MTVDHDALFSAWKVVTELADGLLDPIDTPERHAAALKLEEVAWAAQRARPELSSLLRLLTENIQSYEAVAFPQPVRSPGQVLASLMTVMDLSPAALAQSTGIGIEELDRLVTGQQDLTRAQMHLLAERLHVDPLIFL